MKKNLLILAFAAPLLAFGQKPAFFMGDGVSVKVQKQTLVYTNGEFKVKEGSTSATSNENKFSNYGNIKVAGSFTTEDNQTSPTSTRFVNKFTSGTEYGQLIIKNNAGDNPNSAGKMTGEYKFFQKTKFPYHPIALPYHNYTVQDVVNDTHMKNKDNSPIQVFPTGYDRYRSPVFTVNNQLPQSDNPGLTEPLEPYESHSLNQLTSTITNNSDRIAGLIGRPAARDIAINLPTYTITGKNNELNTYGEYIGSVVSDPIVPVPSGWNNFRNDQPIAAGLYGANIYALGNPFTSNIDLNKLPSNVTAVFVYKSATYTGNDGNDPNTYGLAGDVHFPNGVGDVLPSIKPYQVFSVKTSGGLAFTFNDDFKTFDVKSNTPNILYRSSRTGNEFYQVGFDLYSKDIFTNNKFYVVASDFYKDQGNSEYEAYNIWLEDGNVGFYSLQEKEDGTIAENLSDQKVYINGVNSTDYVAKPIHLVFQGKDNTPYTLKVRLNEALVNSKNTFYFEDKKEGKIMEVTPDFEYTFVEPNLNKDRFVVYWNGLPQTMSTNEVNSSQTQVYKDGDSYKVRFATEFNRADVYVYDLNGRLISSEKSVDASVDHTLPYLSNGKVFIVKVVGDNGVVTSQKIIK